MEAPSPTAAPKKRDKVKQEPVEEGKDGNVLAAEDFTHGGVRKAKFAPKVPTRRLKKLSSLKSESGEGAEAELSSELLKLVKQSQEDAASRGGRRTDIRAPTRVAFGAGSSVAARAAASFSKGGGSGGGGGGSGSGSGSAGDKKSSKSSHGGIESGMLLDEKEEGPKKSTWDLSKYYPVTLPLQKPGDAELLEDDQLGEFEENTAPVADELELVQVSDEDQILFFQLPSFLPLTKAALTAPVKTSEGGSITSIGKSSTKTEHTGSATWLENMPPGHMGKLLVYSSGAVKLRLGDTLYEAVTGSECVFAQELVGINSTSQHCCFLGDMTKKVIVVPCLDEFLETGSNKQQK